MKIVYDGLLYDTDDMLRVAANAARDTGGTLYVAENGEWFLVPHGWSPRNITRSEARGYLSYWCETEMFMKHFGDVPRAKVHPEIAAERKKIAELEAPIQQMIDDGILAPAACGSKNLIINKHYAKGRFVGLEVECDDDCCTYCDVESVEKIKQDWADVVEKTKQERETK